MKIFLKSVFALLIIASIVYGYTLEVPYFSNTFKIQYLFFRALFLGALVGGLSGWFFSKKATDKEDRVPIFLLCLFAGLAIFPLLAIRLNHVLAKHPLLSIKAIFLKEEALRTSRVGIVRNSVVPVDAYYVYFKKDGETERIRCKTQSFRAVEAGQEIELPVKHGFFGFDFYE